MDPSVEQRAASLLSLQIFSHSDPVLAAVKGLYPELQLKKHRLPLPQHFPTVCRKSENKTIKPTGKGERTDNSIL